MSNKTIGFGNTLPVQEIPYSSINEVSFIRLISSFESIRKKLGDRCQRIFFFNIRMKNVRERVRALTKKKKSTPHQVPCFFFSHPHDPEGGGTDSLLPLDIPCLLPSLSEGWEVGSCPSYWRPRSPCNWSLPSPLSTLIVPLFFF